MSNSAKAIISYSASLILLWVGFYIGSKLTLEETPWYFVPYIATVFIAIVTTFCMGMYYSEKVE